jgi:hypothetical protein
MNPSDVAVNHVEAKLAGLSFMPVAELRVGLQGPTLGAIRWGTVAVAGTSLRALFASNQHVPLTRPLGRVGWLGLAEGANVEDNCNQEGLNNDIRGTGVRIGMVFNNELTCDSVDSWVGLGAKSTLCTETGRPGGTAGWANACRSTMRSVAHYG